MKVLMCDPPSGWMYGFPKPIPEEVVGDMDEWLVSEGYPRSMLSEGGTPCRFWEVDDD